MLNLFVGKNTYVLEFVLFKVYSSYGSYVCITVKLP